jgi:arsenate reductase
MINIYHNPRCSKSRQALALLEAADVPLNIILYLDTPPSFEDLEGILRKLGITARELLRKTESAYKENNLSDNTKTESELIETMASYPKLIERPIITKGNKAVIGRPPEIALEII